MRVTVADDLRRSRLTVFFRVLLALPHLVFFWAWASVAQYAVVLAWFWALATGALPEFLHRFLTSWIRYGFQLGAYLHLIANPFPGFIGRSGYPVDLVLPAQPVRQRRLTVLFRGFLVYPALLLALTLATFAHGLLSLAALFVGGGVAATVALLGWFAALALGRMPGGLRDLGAYSLGYAAQAFAYAFLVVDRYPSSDPEALGPEWPLPEHAVRLELTDDGRRSRLTVFFRYLLSFPHFIWLVLWSVPALLAAIANWFATLVRGQPAAPLHRFLAAYVRYVTHVIAFLFLVANPFPGFTGAFGYPVDVTLPGPVRQSRWRTLFRGILVLPAILVGTTLSYALYAVAFLGWFAALVTGWMPTGLRKLGAVAIRYLAQTYAYWFMLTDRYPHASPALRPPPDPDQLMPAEETVH